MNFESFKLNDGRCALGLRIRVPDGDYRRRFFTPPALMAAQLLAQVFKGKLTEAGLTGVNVHLVGDFCDCLGMILTPQPGRALPAVDAALPQCGLVVHWVEYFILDVHEAYWRPLRAHSSEPFTMSRMQRELAPWQGELTVAILDLCQPPPDNHGSGL